jgi:hypothetical protein
MSKSPGFSIRIFIPSGEPEGLRIVEKSNWTGQGLVLPRARFTDIRQRPELKRTGANVLWGPGESGQQNLVRHTVMTNQANSWLNRICS